MITRAQVREAAIAFGTDFTYQALAARVGAVEPQIRKNLSGVLVDMIKSGELRRTGGLIEHTGKVPVTPARDPTYQERRQREYAARRERRAARRTETQNRRREQLAAKRSPRAAEKEAKRQAELFRIRAMAERLRLEREDAEEVAAGAQVERESVEEFLARGGKIEVLPGFGDPRAGGGA